MDNSSNHLCRLLIDFAGRVASDDGLAIGGAQVGPIDIRAQILTTHLSIGEPLNGWAAIGWEWAGRSCPLVNCADRHIEKRG